jgi:hypothetical protein
VVAIALALTAASGHAIEPAYGAVLAAPAPPVGVSIGSFTGRGSRVLTVRVKSPGALVFTATHDGYANFIVRFVGKGLSELLVNEIGSYAGQVAVDFAKAGRYRVPIEADGAWTLKVTRPIPGPSAKVVPATFKGNGSRVILIRAKASLQPIVTARHRGGSNFIVYLIGYGTLTGSSLLFNEIGNFNGQTLVDDMPAGPYLLAVQADGAWTLKFTR